MSDVVARLDDLGRPAWIALMVGGFIVFWPFGLAVLGYLLWSGRMRCGGGSWGENPRERWERKISRLQEKVQRWSQDGQSAAATGYGSTGNRAFDEYRADTLRRLEEEAREFRSFLDRLRHAKDKAEFEQFMSERRSGGGGAPGGQPGPQSPSP